MKPARMFVNAENSPEIERIENPSADKSVGVYVTPAIIVDGEVKVTGKAPTVDQIKKYLFE